MNKKIRSQFPFLKRKFPTPLKLRGTSNGRTLAYLDNASTTQKPQAVIDAIADVYKNHYANIHRGVYDLSQEATEAYEGVRKKVAKFIGAKDSAEVIFTRNTTESINLVAYCLQETLTGGEILLSQMEHHSNIVPWQMLASRAKIKSNYSSSETVGRIEKFSTSSNNNGVKIKYIPIDKVGRLVMSSVDKLVTKKTKIVSLTLMSNVLGAINPIKEIIKRIHNQFTIYNLPAPLVLIDAAQAAAHMKINVGGLGCDFLVFSAHKMYGPSGVGVLWGKKKLLEAMPPFIGGGDMILSVDFEKTTFNELPWKFEAGTPNIADVIAFGEAVDFIEEIGFSRMQKHEADLTDYALKRLSKIPEVIIYGPQTGVIARSVATKQSEIRSLRGVYTERSERARDDNMRGPVIAFNVNRIHPHDVASILSEEAVAIRSGHHCAQPLMSVLGVPAVCRASFGIYNTKEEVNRLIKGIEKVKKIFDLNTTKVSLRGAQRRSNLKRSPRPLRGLTMTK